MEYTTKEFGKFIRYMRKAINHTQKDLGRAMNCAAGTIGAFERGDKLPQDPNFEKDLRKYVKCEIRSMRKRGEL